TRGGPVASRRETAAKRQLLASTIRTQVESGEMSAGTMLPTVRALQAEHGLSASIVHEELRKLVADGLLISRPGVGFYVAEREVEDPDTFLMVLPANRDNFVWPEILDRTRLGFEAQITELGGATSVISVHAPL